MFKPYLAETVRLSQDCFYVVFIVFFSFAKSGGLYYMDSHSAETMQETESSNSIPIRSISSLSYFEQLIHIWWQWEEHVLNRILLSDVRHSVFVLNIQTQNKNYFLIFLQPNAFTMLRANSQNKLCNKTSFVCFVTFKTHA